MSWCGGGEIRPTQRGDVAVDLVAGQLPALAGLGALGDLDLKLVGVHQVVDRDAETTRCHLLDGRAALVAEAGRVLAALARVRFPPKPVHPDGERLVRLGRQRAEAHSPRLESLRDLGGRLDLLERDGLQVFA
jgi:hypothetical protein